MDSEGGDMMKYKQILGIAVALGMIALGIAREEPLLVVRKAINICMECIGLG